MRIMYNDSITKYTSYSRQLKMKHLVIGNLECLTTGVWVWGTN